MTRADRLVDAVTGLLVTRPGTIVLVSLLITVALAPGITMLETDEGPEEFLEDVPEWEALQTINDEFTPVLEDEEPTTQLIQEEENVLDRGGLLAMLRTQERIEAREDLRVVETSSPASLVAVTVDPRAQTLDDQINVIEGASEREIREAVRTHADDPGFTRALSDDFNPEAAQASATIGTVTHSFPGDPDLTAVQTEVREIADRTDGDIIVFGGGIMDAEFEAIIFDTLLIVLPASALLILLLLVFAFRDPFDLLLALFGLVMVVVWTFGMTGWLGFEVSQILVAVPVLLLAVGIDFGIHTINRYREERAAGADVEAAMRRGMGQLLVAFFLITATTVIGFLANRVSELEPIREFGLVAGIGIVFTLLIFGVFLPAVKIWSDRLPTPERLSLPVRAPLGTEGSRLGRLLMIPARIARVAPVVVVVAFILAAAVAGGYGLGVDTTFDDRDFLPPEDEPAHVEYLPGPMQPGEYTVTTTLNLLEDRFETGLQDTVIVHLEDRLVTDSALAEIARVEEDPPGTFVRGPDGTAASDSIVTVIERAAATDEEFAALVDAQDRTGDGIPDRHLELVYDEVHTVDGVEAERFIAEDHRSARLVYEVESDAPMADVTADARSLTDEFRGDAVATGEIVLFQAVSEVVLETAFLSLLAALVLAGVFLIVLYRVLTGYGTLGLVNLLPVVVTVCLLVGTMRWLGIPFNALTATILAITLGLGVDYTVHITHRFYDEIARGAGLDLAIERTIRGTGGALTGTWLTTALGIGVLVLGITPIVGQFGMLTALSMTLAYLTSVMLLPATLVVWANALGVAQG